MFHITDNPEFDELDTALNGEEDIEDEDTETGEEGEDDEETPAPGTDDQQLPAPTDPRIPKKFEGKTAAEIAEAYTNLEAMVNTKALEIAQNLMGGKAPNKEAVEQNEVEDDLGLTEEQLKNMSPKQFLQHINKTVTEKAKKIVADTLARTTQVRATVKAEVRDVTKNHPHLKTNTQYRSIVLDMIDAAQARGEKLTLKDACKKADEAMGIKVEPPKPAAPAAPKKKPRTGVETVIGTDGDTPLDDEEQVRAGILNAGARGGLGGL